MVTLHCALTLVFLATGFASSSGGFIDTIEELVTAICATLASVPSVPRCIVEFTNELDEWSSSANAKFPASALCCAVNKLEECILQDVKPICGKNAEKAAKAATKLALKGIKFLANQLADENDQIDCDWDDLYYDKASPLCWTFGAQILAGVLLSLLLFTSCCCCYCCCRARNRKTQHVKVFIPRSSNQLFPQRQNPPYRSFDNTDV